MTKKKASNCADCVNFINEQCAHGHRPYFFKGIGYRKVCKDFQEYKPNPVGPTLLQRIRTIFGV